MVSARKWRIMFEVEFPQPESRTSIWRWFHKFSKWLEKRTAQVLIRIEPIDPDPLTTDEGEPVDYYTEVGF